MVDRFLVFDGRPVVRSSFRSSASLRTTQRRRPGPIRFPIGGQSPRRTRSRRRVAPLPECGARGLGNQAKGVQLRPNDGRPENELPYTPLAWNCTNPIRPSKGPHAVPRPRPTIHRVACEPLGFPRYNHYDLGVQIFQDEHKVAMLYHYDNRWRIIWTDGRSMPKLIDGGVEIDGQYREQRFFGYSVGRWIDDYTLEVQTVGTLPEDRVWLDNTGRPISDQARITETFRRLDNDTLEWSETIDDPKIYTRPWQTMKIPMTLAGSPHRRADALWLFAV